MSIANNCMRRKSSERTWMKECRAITLKVCDMSKPWKEREDQWLGLKRQQALANEIQGDTLERACS